MAKAVVSTIGTDRPGLIAELATAAHDLGINIEDSRMTLLGGEFAVLMSIEGSPSELTAFETQLQQRSGAGFACLFQRTSDNPPAAGTRAWTGTVTALDHPGIVASIATFFSERQINISDLLTETTPAPHTGTPMFTVHLTAELSPDQEADLVADFEAFCSDADLDGSLRAN